MPCMHASHLDVILLELGQGIVKELAALALILLLGDVVARLHVENHVLVYHQQTCTWHQHLAYMSSVSRSVPTALATA